MVRWCVRFTGRVQGVGFRATTRALAREYTVTGWVRNEPDGSVAMEVQGTGGEVGRFLTALRERVAGLIRAEESTPANPVEGESGFEIVR